jgi:hypothetical protein
MVVGTVETSVISDFGEGALITIGVHKGRKPVHTSATSTTILNSLNTREFIKCLRYIF